MRGDFPLIAVNGLLEPDESGEPGKLCLRQRYVVPLLRAGAIPIVPTSLGGPDEIRRLLERVDGLLLTGGDDFETERLGLGPTHPAAVVTPAEKQDWDIELARAAIELHVPVLGICYGMQCLVLAEGGDLFQHLPEDRPDGREHRGDAEHDVRVEPGTLLASVLGVERLAVVSRHHQAIRDPGPVWKVAALDDEGLIEGVERRRRAFAVGVQWHPELSPLHSPHERLFRGLVAAASERAALRDPAPARP